MKKIHVKILLLSVVFICLIANTIAQETDLNSKEWIKKDNEYTTKKIKTFDDIVRNKVSVDVNWTNTMSVYGLIVMNNKTRETIRKTELDAEISIDVEKGEIEIATQDELDKTLSKLSFNKNLIDDEDSSLDLEYNKRIVANPPSDKTATYIVRVNRKKDSNEGIFALIIPDKTYVFYFTQK